MFLISISVTFGVYCAVWCLCKCKQSVNEEMWNRNEFRWKRNTKWSNDRNSAESDGGWLDKHQKMMEQWMVRVQKEPWFWGKETFRREGLGAIVHCVGCREWLLVWARSFWQPRDEGQSRNGASESVGGAMQGTLWMNNLSNGFRLKDGRKRFDGVWW